MREVIEVPGMKASGPYSHAVKAGGSWLDQVVNTTVIVADAGCFLELNALYAEYFPVGPPARMTMQVTIPKGLLISIGWVATAE